MKYFRLPASSRNGGNYQQEEIVNDSKIALKVEEAAEYTGIGRNTMRDLVKAKKLPILYVGRKHLIRIDALNDFLKLNEGVDLRDIDSVKAVR